MLFFKHQDKKSGFLCLRRFDFDPCESPNFMEVQHRITGVQYFKYNFEVLVN